MSPEVVAEYGFRPGGISEDPRLTGWMQDLPRKYVDLKTTLEDIPEGYVCICGGDTEKVYVSHSCYAQSSFKGPLLVVFAEKVAGYRCVGRICVQEEGDEPLDHPSHEALKELFTEASKIFHQLGGNMGAASLFQKASSRQQEIIDSLQ